MTRRRSKRSRDRPTQDPLQVNLRWLVALILLVVILPTVVVTGIGITVIVLREEALDLVFGVLVCVFAASVIAGALLLVILARRGARLARIQETFLSHMGHQILTPLAGIRLHGQILNSIELPAEARASVDAIHRESSRLQSLIERILGWRRIRSPSHLYHENPTTVGAIVRRVVDSLPDVSGLEVSIRDPDAALLVDEEAVTEAVTNLVQNAVKYAGDAGPVELLARKFGGRAIFAVSDRGPGLPMERPERLFDPFFRLVRGDEPDPGGSGLGLTIARQIARAHGGRITASARKDGGARFTIVIPLEEIAP